MATTRLRKTFKYPDDNSDDSDPSLDGLDEEEQENLIASLRASEARTNAQYNLIFSILPLTIVVPFVYYLFSAPGFYTLPCLLSITSLLCSAYTMRFIPLQRALAGSDGPISIFLPYLNPMIAALLGVVAWVVKGRTSSPDGLWIFLLLPAVVQGMVEVARRSMADIETGLRQLDGLKYEYRGA